MSHIEGHSGRQDDRERQEPADARHPTLPRITSSQLLGARGELIIEHGSREYRLRITHSGKLILTA